MAVFARRLGGLVLQLTTCLVVCGQRDAIGDLSPAELAYALSIDAIRPRTGVIDQALARVNDAWSAIVASPVSGKVTLPVNFSVRRSRLVPPFAVPAPTTTVAECHPVLEASTTAVGEHAATT